MIRRALRGGRVVPRRSNPSDDPLEVQMRLAEDVWSNGSWEADDVRSAVRLILKAERVAVEASTLASQPVLKGVEYFRALASSSNAARRAMPIRHSAINSAIVAPMRQLTGFSLGSVVNVEDDYGEPTGQLLFPTWPEDRVLVAAARRAPAKAAAAFQAAAAPPPLRALPAHASLTAEQEAAINAAEAVFGYAGEILETVADPQLQGALRRLETTGAATSGGVGATFARNLRREAERRAFYAGQVESADVSMLALPALFRAAVGTGVVTVKDIVPPPPPERAGLISALGANALQAGRALAKPDRPAALRAAAFVLDAAERLGGWPALVRADKWLERLRISPPEVNKYRLLLNDLRARRAAYVLEASRVADVPIIERRAYAVEATVGVEDELAGAGPGVATKHIKRKLAAEFSFRGWKTVRDGSIGGGAELVSPVLAWPRDGKLLAGVIAGAQFAGLRPCGSCGLHVHVGAKDLTWKMLKTLVVLGQRWRHELRLLCTAIPDRLAWADTMPIGAFASLEGARNERELWCAYYGRAEKCALPSKTV